MAVELSVVIPTYNRIDVLPEVLLALEGEAELPGSPSLEVVVIDDGSIDGTGDWLEGRAPSIPMRVLRQENRGPAAARNAGVEAAAGRWVAFLGDDTVPRAGWSAAHRAAQRGAGDGAEIVVLGRTRWHRRMRVNRFLDFINEQGLQFGYGLIDDPQDVPFNFFYTSNVSLQRERLLAEPFDLRFPYPAWEDSELAYRLQKGGFRMIYEPSAVAEHLHPTDFDRFCDRQEKAGFSAVVFYRLHPELGAFLGVGSDGPPPVPSSARQRFRECLVRSLQSFPMTTPRLWEKALRFHYIRGLNRAWIEGAGLNLESEDAYET